MLEVASECQRSCPCAWHERSGPEWRSGRSPATPVDCSMAPYPTFSHLATRFPTLPSDGPLVGLDRALQGRTRPGREGRLSPFPAIPVAPAGPGAATQMGFALLQQAQANP